MHTMHMTVADRVGAGAVFLDSYAPSAWRERIHFSADFDIGSSQTCALALAYGCEYREACLVASLDPDGETVKHLGFQIASPLEYEGHASPESVAEMRALNAAWRAEAAKAATFVPLAKAV